MIDFFLDITVNGLEWARKTLMAVEHVEYYASHVAIVHAGF